MSRSRKISYYNKNKARYRDRMLRNIHGITELEYQAMLHGQGYRCAICDKPAEVGKNLAVDHCHLTGFIRGLLCTNCNQALGHFRDSTESLHKAITYIETNRSMVIKLIEGIK